MATETKQEKEDKVEIVDMVGNNFMPIDVDDTLVYYDEPNGRVIIDLVKSYGIRKTDTNGDKTFVKTAKIVREQVGQLRMSVRVCAELVKSCVQQISPEQAQADEQPDPKTEALSKAVTSTK